MREPHTQSPRGKISIGTNDDNCSIYGDSEALIGKWFKRTGKRNDIVIASKFGMVLRDGKLVPNSSGKYAKEACEKSLKTLGIDSIDLC
jgi:aryl-alcohol dehydrogenase-like predicted oxidoreductase